MFRIVAVVSALSLGQSGSPVQAQVIYPAIPVAGPPVQVLYPVVPVHTYQVQFRQWDWRERSFSNPFDAQEFAFMKRSEGFETVLIRHTFHTHVRYRLPVWVTYRTVSSHHLAHEYARHLQSRGYETRVVHY